MIPTLRFRHIVIDELSLYYDNPTDLQETDLHNLFCNNSESILKRAVKLLKKSYKFKRFPFPADIQTAIDHANMERSRDSIDPDVPREYCDRCYGMGIWINERGLAEPCRCAEGQKVRRGWQSHYREHRYFRAEPMQKDRSVEAL